MKKILPLFLCAVFYSQSFAIVPPASSVKPPANFESLKKEISKDYKQGYYAKKFAERKMLNQQLAKGTSSITLPPDTTFALTLLGRYSDASPIYSAEQFQAHLFDGPNPTGTVTEYFTEASYDQLYFTGSCAGWYDMPKTLAQYVGNNDGLGTQGGPRFVLDIVTIADSSINYADYIQYDDNNGNPRIGFIAVVHTGSDAAAGGNNIWSHRWNFRMINGGQAYQSNDTDPVSGKKVLIDGDYAIQPELEGSNNNGGQIKAIGVFAHEFGHIFGLPDLYDTDNSSEGLGNWCLMAGGSYGGNGNTSHTPVHLSAWGKEELGWVTPIKITGLLKDLVIPNVEENKTIYKMWKNDDPSTNEYFLVENRQKIGFDINLYNSGLLIFHIDNNINGNSDENHPLIDIEQADGKRNLNLGSNRGDDGDTYPGSSNNLNFDLLSTPNSNSYNLQKTFVSVRNIKHNGNNMIADLDVGTVPFIVADNFIINDGDSGNGRLEPEETGNISFVLSNIEFANSSQTKINFSINDPDIEILIPESINSVDGQSDKTINVNSAISVKPEFQGKMVYLNYSIESEGNSYSDSVKFPIGIPDILVVSKAERDDLVNYYDTSFSALGFSIEEVLNGEPEFLKQRKIIVYLSGQTKDSMFTATEIDSLNSYIIHGGKLFFSGQNIAQYLKDNYPSFLNDQIGINWDKTGNILFYRKIFGVPSDVIGSQINELSIWGADGAQNERTPDIISSNGDFQMSFSYKENLSEGAGGWIEKPSGAKILFLGFGFESINNPGSSKTRDEVLQILTSWFNSPVSVSDEIAGPISFNLFQNYPNPFNPSTQIRFSVPANAQKAVLKVYDVLGKEVTTLINEQLNAGEYVKEFNGKDQNGKQFASGVYYYTLKVGDLSQTKKMVYLK